MLGGLSNILTDWVGNKPVERVVRSLKGSTSLSVAEKEAIANTLLNYGIVGDIAKREGTISLENKIGDLEYKAGQIVNAYKSQDATVPIIPTIKALQALKKKAMEGEGWEKRIGDIDTAIKDLETNPLLEKGRLPIDTTQSLKVDFGKKARWGEYTDFQNLIRQTANRSLSEQLGLVAPEFKPLNAELGPLYEAMGPVAKAESRISNLEEGISLKQSGHGMLGPLGRAYGAIKGVTESNRVSPLIAQGMHNLKSELNPVARPEITLPDFMALGPKPPLSYDISTGMRTNATNPSSLPANNMNLPVGGGWYFDSTIGKMMQRRN